MDLQMAINHKIQQDSASKEAATQMKKLSGEPEGTTTEKAGVAASHSVELRNDSANARPADEAQAAKRPAYDRYVPEIQSDKQSSGLYQPVPDGEGGMKIQFDDPAGGVKTEKDASAPSASSEDGAEKAAADSGEEKTEAAQDGQEQMHGGTQKVQQLTRQKKQLEKQIRSARDAGTAERLKQKLAQVKRQLQMDQW